jgi:hypothetical protein
MSEDDRAAKAARAKALVWPFRILQLNPTDIVIILVETTTGKGCWRCWYIRDRLELRYHVANKPLTDVLARTL